MFPQLTIKASVNKKGSNWGSTLNSLSNPNELKLYTSLGQVWLVLKVKHLDQLVLGWLG